MPTPESKWFALGREYELNSRTQRTGQAMMNALYAVDPDVERTIVGTLDDPFHNDRALAGFFQRVAEAWGSDGLG